MDYQTRLSLRRLLIALLLGVWPLAVMATDCSFCQDGPGDAGESGSGTRWLKDTPANIKDSDDRYHYRPESLGPVNTHESVTWRKDGLGNIKGSDGSIYRPNSQGQYNRNGKTSLPPHIQKR